jgi:endoglucanase
MYQAVDPFVHNQQLGRGVNIIGYDPIWKSTGEGRIQAKHFKLIKQVGFQHVRIDLHPFGYMGDAPDYTISPKWLETLDWVMEQCRKNELLVILDMHEFKAMGKDPVGMRPKFLAFWKQFAPIYKNSSSDVLFEILNEPNAEMDVDRWNTLFPEALRIIRETNPTRTVIIGPANSNGIERLCDLTLPEDDRHIIATCHYYSPMPFTHQGAPWSDKYRDKTGILWSGTKSEIADVKKDLQIAQDWAKQHNRPIYLGEFGAYDAGDLTSRVLYTETVAREAEALGWSWGYWQFDSDFIVYDIDKDTWVMPILHALLP